MRINNRLSCSLAAWLVAMVFAGTDIGAALAQSAPLVGPAAFGDWRADRPGVSRLIKPDDLQRPGATPSSANVSRGVPRPSAARPQVPTRCQIQLLAEGL